MIFFFVGGGWKKGLIGKTGGNKHGVRNGGTDDDMTAPQR